MIIETAGEVGPRVRRLGFDHRVGIEVEEVGGGLCVATAFYTELSRAGWGLAKRLIEATRVVFR